LNKGFIPTEPQADAFRERICETEHLAYCLTQSGGTDINCGNRNTTVENSEYSNITAEQRKIILGLDYHQ
jgi:uncharacterized protein YraI